MYHHLRQNDGRKEYYSCPVIYLKLIACIGFISFQLTGEKLIENMDLCSDVRFSDRVKTYKSPFCPYPFQISAISFFFCFDFFYLFPRVVGLFDTSLTPSFPSSYATRCRSIGPSLSLFLPYLFCLLSCMISRAFCTHLGLSQLHVFFSTLIFNSCLIQCFQTYSPYVLFLCFQGCVSNTSVKDLPSPSLD